MRRCIVTFLASIAVMSAVSSLRAQTGPSSGNATCQAFFEIAPVSLHTMILFDFPVALTDPKDILRVNFYKVEEWDFPSTVTRWRTRMAEKDYADLHEQFTKAWFAAQAKSEKRKRSALIPVGTWLTRVRPERQAFTPSKLTALKEWFDARGQERVPKICVDPARAMWLLEVGRVDYRKPTYFADGSLRPRNAADVMPVVLQEYPKTADPPGCDHDEAVRTDTEQEHNPCHLNSPPPPKPPRTDCTCGYLYGRDAPGGKLRETPEYFYCNHNDFTFRKVTTKILERLSKDLYP